ncbi:MAG: 1,4-alpha-glucan branching protein GlgB [Ignavibacteriae bacterium]|nr:1,4-alpha-glucan branching protein GlgB [Ignavibacteriota bacterium]MCB9243816.1 1,4-alpha-glucan branching protein GlgB [Ignavibacteriales bacterium]
MSKKSPSKQILTSEDEQIRQIRDFECQKPFDILGPHKAGKKSMVIRAFLPGAERAWVIPKEGNERQEMERIGETDVFSVVFKKTEKRFPYIIEYTDGEGNIIQREDPYYFPTILSKYDLHLFGEGNNFKIYEKLGAHVREFEGVTGTHFAVWAPNARAVSVIGEFNSWNNGAHPMENVNGSGIWVLFVPEVTDGSLYKYAVKSALDDEIKAKSDPYAFYSELRPSNASVVHTLGEFEWNDMEWMADRKEWDYKRSPISIYEVHLCSWKRDHGNTDFPNEWGFMNYRQLAHEIVDHVKEMGYTHIELLPVMEHPLDKSWGYQVVNYFAPTSRHGTPEDFMYFVDHCHYNCIGVILDWVPGHFPTDEHGLYKFDGTEIYAYDDPRKGFHKEWGTMVFDYGKNQVRNFLISNALFWFEKYHLDGLRVDAVASMLYLDYSRDEGEWEPNIFGGNENIEAIEFLRLLNEKVHESNKGIMMIAEESTAWKGVTKPVYLGGLGFDMKWNMGWMHDVLYYFSLDPIHRKFHHNKITFSLWYSFDENFVLPISHDEVVYGKRTLIEKFFGDIDQRFATLKLFFGFMFAHPGKKLNFMINDIAQYNEWNSEAQVEREVLEFERNSEFNLFFKGLSHLYKEHVPFYDEDFKSDGFQWIDFTDADAGVLSFIRYTVGRKDFLVFTFNMTPIKRENYVLGVPEKGFYREIFNSDAVEYGGSGEGNLGGIEANDEKRYSYTNSISITLPPLAVNIFKLEE